MKIKEIQSVYFIGIGGIGMSAIARYFLLQGATVNGYDKTESPLTKQLVKEGASVFYKEDVSRIPKQPDLVVYTPAIPEQHTELQFYLQSDVQVVKRAAILGQIVNEGNCFAVAGSHGKSTTSAMLAHILQVAGNNCTAFLGAIASNYNSNFIPGNNNCFVVEADEYDRSFHQIHPTASIITSIDSDHLDIYETIEGVREAFNQYVNKLRPGGKLFIHENYTNQIAELPRGCEKFTYGQSEQADFRATNLKVNNGGYSFRVSSPYFTEHEFFLPMGGIYNLENALAVIAIATSHGVSVRDCEKALKSFTGLKRRFEYVLNSEQIVFIDDYAHHPNEIRSFVKAVKEIYPKKKLTAVFQPHLYSRTKDYYRHFAQSLDLVDEVFIMDIYPAREEAIPGVNADLIANEMQNSAKVVDHNNLLENLQQVNTDVFLTIGAGDIAKKVPEIKDLFVQKLNTKKNG